MDAELDSLCRSCGLCCDGSLFGIVHLDPAEVEPARRAGLRIHSDGRSFEQPCPAFADDGREACCTIYGSRPAACRSFVCKLRDRHRREGGALAPRLEAVRRVRHLLALLRASGRSPSDFDQVAGIEEPLGSAYAELMRRLEADFARA